MLDATKNDYRHWFIGSISLLLITGIWFVNPIPQDLHYHQFADQITLLGVPNFWNVISNAPFVFVALFGFWKVSRPGVLQMHSLRFYQAWVVLIGVFLTGFGSAYYHYNPNNATLVWDRMPLTLAFMAFLSVVIAEYLSHRMAKKLFLPLLLIGVTSIVYWDYTESIGQGDLRLYALVQFLPMIVIPFVLGFYSDKSKMTPHLWWTLIFYGLAKLLEHFDAYILDTLNIMGGHALKHVVAAIAVIYIIKAISSSTTDHSAN